MIEPKEIQSKITTLITRAVLVFWVGTVVFVYLITYWPPVLWPVAEGLGITGLIWDLQVLIKPLFTAPYAPG